MIEDTGAYCPRLAVVSRSAVIKRINRRLEKDGELLRTSRGKQAEYEVGKYFVIDFFNGNLLVDRDVDLEVLARGLGVLRDHEHVAKE
jgi:hypothetical protein